MNKVVSKICILMVCNFIAGLTAHAQTVIGGTNGNPSAVLELHSNDRGLLLPRLTSAERSAIASPAEGLVIYNTTEGCVEINLGSSASPDWNCLLAITGRVGSVDCEAATQMGTLIAGKVAEGVSISIPYTGGSGGFYKGQTVSSTGVTGLTAIPVAGNLGIGSGSVTYTITGIPVTGGTAHFELNIGGQTCTIELSVICGAYVASGVWKQFMCHNLGSNTSADPFMPSWELNGNYYQWGRNPTCFGRDGTDDANLCNSPVYGAAGPWGNTTANANAGAITGWSITAAANGAWVDGSKTINDPCPAGWRVPTAADLTGLASTTLNPRTPVYISSDSSTNYAHSGVKFGQSLFLPIARYRQSDDGLLDSNSIFGFYWSSTESGSDSRILYISTAFYVGLTTFTRTYGSSLRCVAE